MITSSTFGTQGRLGNQMFQFGLLFAVAQRLGRDFYLPRCGESLWDCFDIEIPTAGPVCPNVFEEVNGSCNYDPRVFEQPDGTSYHGFFQSYRYYDDCRVALARFLRFKRSHRDRSALALASYRHRYRRPIVSMHIRRGDYLDHGAEDHWGNLMTDGYYDRVIAEVDREALFVVFSDDLPWCRRSLAMDCVEFADFDAGTSLCLMTRCDVNVVANSTFSWWGAFLNPSAEVYAPRRWYGPAMSPPNDRQDDIVPPDWRTIPTFES